MGAIEKLWRRLAGRRERQAIENGTPTASPEEQPHKRRPSLFRRSKKKRKEPQMQVGAHHAHPTLILTPPPPDTPQPENEAAGETREPRAQRPARGLLAQPRLRGQLLAKTYYTANLLNQQRVMMRGPPRAVALDRKRAETMSPQPSSEAEETTIDGLSSASPTCSRRSSEDGTYFTAAEDARDVMGVYAPRSLGKRRPLSGAGEDGFESAAESGYLSGLELHTPSSLLSEPVSPRSISDRIKRPRAFVQKSEEALNVKDRSPVWPLSRAATLERLPSTGLHPVETFLRNNVWKTKFVTCVFEADRGGIDVILEDIQHEIDRWMGEHKSLLAIACEVHWSTPESLRNRGTERKMKEHLLTRLRDNNRRLLNLQCEGAKELPLHLAEATTEEDHRRDGDLNAYQGVYRRCYRNLMPYAHADTHQWHSAYWTLENATSRPRPEKFLFGDAPKKLAYTSLVAVNLAGLRISGNNRPRPSKPRPV